ncbi:phosphoribosylglycinamide formyltransferase [Tahibacter amnicola]|uniref:Phosphoribosylglycinamide formyltransferase n=1 Tax=Tahibacter amnicola TaxID=2976241 RepID=A0ABY6BHV4_9GAMM|nr:phosphoribosylglycinamide formyltransferase [Tahibacter amnicola]UXI69435.1 phosphoribosylglycinamide formyltransferase [Tahibacter amnicola]
MSAPFRIAVLISGRGSNLQALIDAQQAGALPVEILLVASNKATAEGLRKAEAAGIPTLALDPAVYPDRASYDHALFSRVAASGPDLIVLAGFMRIIDPAAVAGWHGRMINIHPSLLPKYPGLKTHQRAIAAGDTVHGASVHFVTAELDGGPVIAQVELPILPGDTPDALAERLLRHEHRLLCHCVAQIAAGRITLGDSGVLVEGQPLGEPLRLFAD